MFQKNIDKLLLCIVISGALLTSCHSSQQLMEPSLGLHRERPQQMSALPSVHTVAQTGLGKVSLSDGMHHSWLATATGMLRVKYATMMGVMPEAIVNTSLYHFIEDWYGVRYRLGGNDKRGIDCSAFAQRLYEQVFCTSLVRTAMEQFVACQYLLCEDSLAEGDLLFFKHGSSRISHVGIYLVNNFFVHASSSQGVTISNLNDRYWSKYYAGAGRVGDRQTSF